jgi:hypothetical protein
VGPGAGAGGSATGASAGDGSRASAASSSSTLDPLDVVKRVKDLCETRLRVVDGDDPLSGDLDEASTAHDLATEIQRRLVAQQQAELHSDFTHRDE